MLKKLTILALIILVISSALVNYLDAQKIKDSSEEEYIELKLKELGWPPYVYSGSNFKPAAGEVYLPVKNFYDNQTVNPFGIYRNGRFLGYHSGVDIEVDPEDLARKVPVYSIFEGEVKAVKTANGYGGVVAVEHPFGEVKLMGIYGHVRLWDANVKVGQKISSGYLIGYLGADNSNETDGERKHLHFGLSKKTDEVDIKGYVEGLRELKENWINPSEFLKSVGAKPME
ncbi:MAG: M23 family metallopeptidase [Parcubacteria group bacterium]|nr:M23 family metallopeptidase [Parcubacteria group bacterium]